MRLPLSKTVTSIVALFAGAAALAPGASAQIDDTDYCVDYEYLYEETDYYDDVVVSRDEYVEIGNAWFSNWDVDDSGFIEEDEFTICYDAIGWDVGDGYVDMDLNADNVLDQEEFFNEDAYDRWDLDNNDELKNDEWF